MAKQKGDRNAYDILGITIDATDRDIKVAYRRKAKALHPDRNLGREEQAATLFVVVKNAYNLLLDEEKRKALDLKLRAKQRQAARFSKMNQDRQDLEATLKAREKQADLPKKVTPASKLAEIRRQNKQIINDSNERLRMKRKREPSSREPEKNIGKTDLDYLDEDEIFRQLRGHAEAARAQQNASGE